MPDKLGWPTAIDRLLPVRQADGTTRMTPVADVIIDRIRLGTPQKHAAISAGIHVATMYLWLTTARTAKAMLEYHADQDLDPYQLSAYETACIDFLDRMEVARGEFTVRALGQVQQAAAGGVTSTRKVTKTVKRAGVVVSEETTETQVVEGPVWQANAWLLERLHPDEFGRFTRTEVTLNPGGEVPAEERAKALGETIRGVLGRAIETDGTEVGEADPQ